MIELLAFRDIQWTSVLITIGIMVALALVFGIIIMVVAKFFAPKDENPQLAEIRAHLGGANCGACGKAGCDDFAKALLEGTAKVDDCGSIKKEGKVAISNILGISYDGVGETRVVVACSGGNKCRDKFEYQGYGDCENQQMLANGRKACESGCMGAGSCLEVCPQHAINFDEGYSHISESLCIACGRCIKVCPKQIIKRIPKSAKIYVACSNHEKGKDVINACTAGCIGCGLCEKKCPSEAIHMENNVPVIDYSKCIGCYACADVCPRKVIHRLDK